MADSDRGAADFSSDPAAAPEGLFLHHLTNAADLVAAGRFREGEEEVLQALALSPTEPRALQLLAMVRFKLQRYEDARATCEELVRLYPDDASVRLKLGLIALRTDRIGDAVDELETCTRLAPEELRAWSYLGVAYARAGDHAQAAAAFRRAGEDARAEALERQPDEPQAQTIQQLARHDEDDYDVETSHPSSVDEVGGAHPPGHPSFFPPMDPIEELALEREAIEPAFDEDPSGFQPPDLEEASVSMNRPGAEEPSRLQSRLFGRGAAVPVVPLVGYALSHLAPPVERPVWVGATARLPIGDEIYVRADAVVACSGRASWEPAFRRVRGRLTDEPLGGVSAAKSGADRRRDGESGAEALQTFCRVTGRGDVFVCAPRGRLVPLHLEDDILYLREDHVLAFEGSISWEYGHVPRGDDASRMLQFRGHGLVAVGLHGEPGAVKVTPEHPLLVSNAHLLGWIGRIAASGTGHGLRPEVGGAQNGTNDSAAERKHASAFAPLGILCEGEGVVLVDVNAGLPERARS